MTTFYYNLTNLTNENGTLVDVLRYTNEVTGYMFWPITVFVVWVIMFVSLLPFGEKRAMTTTTFIAAIYSYLLAAMGLMDIALSLIPTIMLVFMILFILLQEGSN